MLSFPSSMRQRHRTVILHFTDFGGFRSSSPQSLPLLVKGHQTFEPHKFNACTISESKGKQAAHLQRILNSRFLAGADARVRHPLEVVGSMIVCCLERGCLHRVHLTPRDIAALVNCTLSALEARTALLYLAVGVWSAVQATLPSTLTCFLSSIYYTSCEPEACRRGEKVDAVVSVTQFFFLRLCHSFICQIAIRPFGFTRLPCLAFHTSHCLQSVSILL